MRMRGLLICGFVLFSPFSCSAEQYGNWFIGTLQSDGQKTGCHMRADYNHGVRLGVVVFKNYAWALSLQHDSWKMKEGQLVEMAAFVDGNMVATGKAEALNSTVAVLPLDKAIVYRALQSGHTLVLTTPSGKLPFDLRGTSKAMDMVLNCVANLQSSNNVAEKSYQQPTNSGDDGAVPRAEATMMLTNMLNAAGLSGYQLSAAKPDTDAIDFVLNDGTDGRFAVIRNAPVDGADILSSKILDGAQKLCKGAFKSGKQPITTTDGSVVRKLAAACSMEGSSIVADITVVRRSEGTLFYLMRTYNEGSGSLNEAGTAQPPSSAFTDAALRFGPNK